MIPGKQLEGPCSNCGQTISYPAHLVGTSGPCPMCGNITKFVLATPPQEPAIPRRTLIFTAVAILVLVLGLIAASVALKKARELKKSEPQSSLGIASHSCIS